MKKVFKKKIFWFLIVAIFLLWLFKIEKHYPNKIDLVAKEDFWGLTYSPKFARDLGLDSQELYLAVIDDLGAKNIRIPIYWDQVEMSEGQFDFSQYDYIFDEGAKRDVKFIANIGWRLPRWPECHNPNWIDKNDSEKIESRIIFLLKQIVTRYQNRPEIVAWQIENEPLFDWFGECPKGNKEFLEKEVALVKNLDDSRPILISASGELSTWRQGAKMADILGTTMYRVVWNPWFRYVRYPIPDWYYQVKLYFNGLRRDEAIISELQAEPWVPNGTLADLEFDEYYKSFSLDQFKANLQFAINVDFKQTYLWGVEWWYYMKVVNNHPEFWSEIKNLK